MVFFAALVINFAIPRMMPGSPIDLLAGGGTLTVEAKEAMIQRFGLDAPVWEQFWRYLAGIFRGDLGVSFAYFPTPVWDVVMEALPWTLLILWTAALLQVTIGYVAGVTAGWKAGTRTDSILQTIGIVLVATPTFWLAMIFLYVFAFQLDWFPLGGGSSIGATYSSTLGYVGDIAKHAALPIAAMVIGRYGVFQLILRNTMVTTLKEQYILTAEAKGLSENRIKYRHAARNSLLPMVTFLALSSSIIISGSVYVETVFSYPGLGYLTYASVLSRDYPVLQGAFLMFTAVVIAANFAVDILYMYLDPRIRY
ncbi:Dipeptide transport system permease protein DppB [subsurface metagenome]